MNDMMLAYRIFKEGIPDDFHNHRKTLKCFSGTLFYGVSEKAPRVNYPLDIEVSGTDMDKFSFGECNQM